MEKLNFQTNVPVELALKYTDGKLSPSQFGDPQYQFVTTDDQIFYVHEKVAKKIQGLRLRPGERIDICKAEVSYTNGRKGIEWQVSRVGETPAQPPAPTKGQRAAEKYWANRTVGEQPDGTFAVPNEAAAGVSAPATVATAQRRSSNSTADDSKPIPTKIPMDQAVVDAVRIVQDAMKETGEQWSDQSRQDLVSTVLITAQREGWLAVWRRPARKESSHAA